MLIALVNLLILAKVERLPKEGPHRGNRNMGHHRRGPVGLLSDGSRAWWQRSMADAPARLHESRNTVVSCVSFLALDQCTGTAVVFTLTEV